MKMGLLVVAMVSAMFVAGCTCPMMKSAKVEAAPAKVVAPPAAPAKVEAVPAAPAAPAKVEVAPAAPAAK